MKIKPFLKLMISIVTDIKIYISRTISWISIANSLMLVFLVIERLSSMGIIKKDLTSSFVVVVGSWFCILVILGWIEVNKIRAPHVESMKMLELNLPMKDVYIRMKEVDDRTKRIEEDIQNMKNNYAQQTKPLKGHNSEGNRYADDILDKDKTAENYGQQKQVKQVPRDKNFSESKTSPDNVGVNDKEGKRNNGI